LGVLKSSDLKQEKNAKAFFDSGAHVMPLYYLYKNSLHFLCTGNMALTQPGRPIGGAKSEWVIRIPKVGNASLLVVAVLRNLSNHEDDKNSSEFLEALGASRNF